MRVGYPVQRSLLLIFFGRGGRAEISGMLPECVKNMRSLSGIWQLNGKYRYKRARYIE